MKAASRRCKITSGAGVVFEDAVGGVGNTCGCRWGGGGSERVFVMAILGRGGDWLEVGDGKMFGLAAFLGSG